MMLSQKEIKTAANKLLHEKTGLKCYGKEVTEGYDTPSLFVELLSKPTRRETPGYAKVGFTIQITFFQKTPNEIEQLEMIDTIKDAFGMIFTVGDRKLTVREIRHDYVGQKEDKLQITVEFEHYDNTVIMPTAELVDEVAINIKETEEAEK